MAPVTVRRGRELPSSPGCRLKLRSNSIRALVAWSAASSPRSTPSQHRCGEREGKVAFDHGIKAGQLLIVAVRVHDRLLDQLVQLCLAQLRPLASVATDFRDLGDYR